MKTFIIKKFINGLPIAEITEKEYIETNNVFSFNNNIIELTKYRFTNIFIFNFILYPTPKQKEQAEEVVFEFPPKQKKWVDEDNKTFEKEVIITDKPGYYFDEEKFFPKQTKDLKRYIQLDNGEWIYNDCGKYCTNLTFLLEKPDNIEYFWKSVPAEFFNLFEGDFKIIIGCFWKSKKGNNCFRPCENGKHILVQEDWTHWTEKTIKKIPHLYYRYAVSNGGRTGYNYIIFEKSKHKMIAKSEDFMKEKSGHK